MTSAITIAKRGTIDETMAEIMVLASRLARRRYLFVAGRRLLEAAFNAGLDQWACGPGATGWPGTHRSRTSAIDIVARRSP